MLVRVKQRGYCDTRESTTIDLFDFRVCSYAEQVGAKHYQTSAKLNRGIDDMFLDLCKREKKMSVVGMTLVCLIGMLENVSESGLQQGTRGGQQVTILDDDEDSDKQGKGCC